MPKTKDYVMSVRLDPDTRKRMEKAARKKDYYPSLYVLEALKEKLDKDGIR